MIELFWKVVTGAVVLWLIIYGLHHIPEISAYAHQFFASASH